MLCASTVAHTSRDSPSVTALPPDEGVELADVDSLWYGRSMSHHSESEHACMPLEVGRRAPLTDLVVPEASPFASPFAAMAAHSSIPSSGAPPGQVPAECFPGETAPAPQPRRRRMSFADEVTMLDEEDSPECSQLVPPLILPVVVEEAVLVSEAGVPSLILPVVEELNNDTPAAELVEMEPSMSESGLPPPPGFPPFVWPEDDGGMDVDDLCTRFVGDSSLALSPISRRSSDLSDAMDAPEVGALLSPLEDSLSEVIPAVGYARLPLPSVDNSLMPDLVWVPALPQPTGRFVDRECPVPRWRLAREGPFLEERSPESIRSLGPGCAFRNTTYRTPDYAEPVWDYGLPTVRRTD